MTKGQFLTICAMQTRTGIKYDPKKETAGQYITRHDTKKLSWDYLHPETPIHFKYNHPINNDAEC